MRIEECKNATNEERKFNPITLTLSVFVTISLSSNSSNGMWDTRDMTQVSE
jgi:hypothetical protein